MRVGVLALQGAFREHKRALARCGVEPVEVRKSAELEGLAGLVLPGGESTAIGRLLVDYHLFQPVLACAQAGMPIFGTCAGMVLLAREIEGNNQPHWGLLEIRVQRNASGRQVASFEAGLEIPVLGEPLFPGVFIRAPYATWAGPQVEVLARYQGKIVFVRQGSLLAASFHPELTADLRVHRYFLEMVRGFAGRL